MEEVMEQLQVKAKTLRRHIIRMTSLAGSGHPGGSLSSADIMTVLYFHELRIDPLNPGWPDRDRFVLSKGHAAPVLYAALAERGFFPAGGTGHPAPHRQPPAGASRYAQGAGGGNLHGFSGQGLSAATVWPWRGKWIKEVSGCT